MQMLYGFDAQVARWVGTRTNLLELGGSRAIGVVRDGRIIAGAVFSNYRDGNIEATIASDDPRWCRRQVLRALFAYPFLQLGCRRMTCIIAADNEKSIKLCTGLGFTIEGRCRKAFSDSIDGVICGLLAEECKWIR